MAATFCNWFGSNGHPAVVPTHLSKPCSKNPFCWQTRPWAAASDASQRHCHLKLAVTEQARRKLQERGMSARQKHASRVDFRHLEKRRRRSSPQAAFGAFAKQPRRRRTVCLRRSWAMGLGRRVPHVTSRVLGACGGRESLRGTSATGESTPGCTVLHAGGPQAAGGLEEGFRDRRL